MTARAPVYAGTYSTTTTAEDVVTFGAAYVGVEIDAHDKDLWVKWGGTAATTDGDDCVRIPAGASKTFRRLVGPSDPFSVVGSTTKYTVAGMAEGDF